MKLLKSAFPVDKTKVDIIFPNFKNRFSNESSNKEKKVKTLEQTSSDYLH